MTFKTIQVFCILRAAFGQQFVEVESFLIRLLHAAGFQNFVLFKKGKTHFEIQPNTNILVLLL